MLTRRHRGSLCGSIVLCLMLVALTGTALAQNDAAGRIVNVRGRVEIFAAAEKVWRPVSAGEALRPNDAIRTGPSGWAAVLLADETLLQLNRNTQFVLKDVAPRAGWFKLRKILPVGMTAPRSVYRLDRGEAWIRNKDRDVLIDVETPTVSAGIRGTEFVLRVWPDDTALLTVLEGVVRAWNEQGSVLVAAREQAITRPGSAPQKVLLVSPEDAVQWTISVPALISFRDMPLTSSNRLFLDNERARLEATLAARPGDVNSMLALGCVLRDQGLAEEAAALFRRVLERDPENPDALTFLGWTYLDRDRPQEALDLFLRVSAPGPMNSVGRSAAYLRLGLWDEAMKAVREGEARHPDFLLLQVQEAALHISVGELKEASSLLEQGCASSGGPDSMQSTQPGRSSCTALLALTRLALGDKTGALRAAQQAIDLSPDAPNAWIILGYAHQAAFDLDRAQAAVEQALALDPRNVTALVDLARLYFGSGYTDRAAEVSERARQLASLSRVDNGDVYSVLGFIRLAQLKTDEAMAAFQTAARLNPGLGEAHLGLALACMRKGDTAAALEEITTAVLLEPRRSIFLSYWAKMLYELRRFQEALDMLKAARSLDPRDPTPELYRAIILRDLNRPTEAVAALNTAIALNDNRAVYRSRFLLDRDLAVKNVSLAVMYNQLGLSAWAANKALASVKDDFTNYAGHLFLAGAWSGFPRAMASELLLARILQPANINTFNSLNEYTPFFEGPGMNGAIAGSIGNFETYGGNVSVNAAVPSANVALNAGAFSDRTDGWRETNYERQDYVLGIGKWDATPKDGFMAMGSRLSSSRGDAAYPRYEWDTQPDPYASNKADLTRLEAGYHHQFAPHADLLLFATHVRTNGTIQSHSVFGPYPFPPFSPYYLETFQVANYKTPYYAAQAQYQFRLRDHQFIFGSAQYWGDNDVDSQTSYFVNWSGVYSPLLYTGANNSPPKRFQAYYIQDIWKISPMITVEAAAYYDRITASNAFSDTRWSFSRLDPRLGLIITPTRADTIRLAGFQYILPFEANRLDPMDVAGVPIFRNNVEGSVAKEVDFTWEHEWSTGYLGTNLFYLDRNYSFKLSQNNTVSSYSQSGRMKGFGAGLNQLIWQGLGLSCGYSYVDVHDENLPSADRRDHVASVGLKYVHPSGISVFAAQTFRYTQLLASGRRNENIWLTDAGVAYEFPGKRGSVSIAAYNIFNNHFNWVTDFFTFSGRVPARVVGATLALYF